MHVLDRIDNDGNYEPGNVRWVTREENCQNGDNAKCSREDVVSIRKASKLMLAKEIAPKYGVSRRQVCDIINRKVWKNV